MNKKGEAVSPVGQRVLNLLQESQQALSAYAILDRLRREGIKSPPTVYRALEKLQALGRIHRIESMSAFVACRHACSDHHGQISPLAICRSCGMVRELCVPALDQSFAHIGDGFLAQVDRKVVELFGLCHACCDKEGGASCLC